MSIRNFLEKLGNQTAQEFAATKGSYSALVAKTAAMNNLDDEATKMFIGIANKQRVELTGDRTKLPATPEEVFEHLKADPTANRVKAAYLYPEFAKTQSGSGLAKCASHHVEETPTEITSIIREVARNNEHTLKQKMASLIDSMEDSYQKIQNNLKLLKTLGVSGADLRAKVASLTTAEYRVVNKIASNLGTVKNAFISPSGYNTEGYLNGVMIEAIKLTKEAGMLAQIETELSKASDNRVKLYKSRERMYV